MPQHIDHKTKTRLFLSLLMLLCFMGGFSQSAASCFSTPATPCCASTGMTITPANTVYSGNSATVTLNVVVSSPSCSSTFSTAYFNYGDGSAMSPAITKQASTNSTFTVSHVYALQNVCGVSVYTVQVCLKDGKEGDDPAFCVKSGTIGIAHPFSSFSMTAIPTSCNTYSFSYTSASPLINGQWIFGNGAYQAIASSSIHGASYTYSAAGTYTAYLTGQGIAPCTLSAQVTPSTNLASDFTYTVVDPCDQYDGVILSVSGYSPIPNTYTFVVNTTPIPVSAQTDTYTGGLQAGTNTITLITSNGTCSVAVTKTVNIHSLEGYTLSALNTGCKTFSLSYGSGAALPNVQWAFGDGTLSSPVTSTVKSITHVYPGAGTYVVSLSDLSNSSCYIETTVNVTDFTTADFSYSVVSVCTPSSGIILSIPNYGVAGYAYTWQINLLSVPASGASATYTSNLVSGSNVVKLTITSGGCSTSISKIIPIGSPSANFDLISPACLNDILSVYNVSPGGDTYQWKIGSGGVQTGMNPGYNYSVTGVLPVTLTISTTYPPGTTCTTSATKNVTVYKTPDATFTISPVTCNKSVTLSLVQPVNVFTSYSIDYGDGSIVSATSGTVSTSDRSHTYTTSATYTVYPIKVTLFNGSCFHEYTQNVVISNNTALIINAPTNFLCPGSPVTINSFISGASPGTTFTYTWTGPGFSSFQPSVSVTASGVYSLTVKSSSPCALTLSGTRSITALAAPTATIEGITPISCTNSSGSATLTIPGALRQQGFIVNGATVAAVSTTANLSYNLAGLVAGTNYVILKNLLDPNCNTTLPIVITKAEPLLNVSVTQPVNCSGASGSATLATSIPGGTVTWYTAANYSTSAISSGAALSISSLAPANYIAHYTYSNCVVTANFAVVQPAITLGKLGGNGACGGATTPVTIQAQFVPSSISGTFTYSLTNMSTSVTTNGGSTNTFAVGAGDYSTTVQANGCTASLAFAVNELDPITLTTGVQQPHCSNPGFVSVSPSGGDGNYTYTWYKVSTPTATTSLVSLATLTAPAVYSVSVKDLSGCAASGPTPGIAVTPFSTVSLVACTGTNTQGTAHAANISLCDVAACVTGGVGPYTFAWYKLERQDMQVEWRFSYNSQGQFIAQTGAVTVTVPVPATTSPTDIALSYNDDYLNTTASYPYWTSTPSYTPLLNNAGLMAHGSATFNSTDPYDYFRAVETVSSTVETFITSYTGDSGDPAYSKNFTDGDYMLYVTDANGCTYPFSMGTLTFTAVKDFTMNIEFVWGLDEVKPAKAAGEEVDPVLWENMIEAAANLASQSDNCAVKKQTELKGHLDNDCSDISAFRDALSVEYVINDHHHTLYYYDRSGRLTKTVPPGGVEYLSSAQINTILANRSAATAPASWPAVTPHRMATTYKYNSFGQLISQRTPDGGATQFIYDSKNRLRFSQNDRQKAVNAFSYTKYDALGRIIEVGESRDEGAGLDFVTLTATANITAADNPVVPVNATTQITKTFYSQSMPVNYYGQAQRYLQNRVSYTLMDETPGAGDELYTYYSYDAHGNVEWIIQDQPGGMDKNYIGYEYDLVSGKVLKVSYNKNRADRFFHRYAYDTENRLVSTETSRNGELWDKDASYTYYAHGPLKRSRIGEDHVQGLDYIYTIQGWLKSVNSPSLLTGSDPGGDNPIGSLPILERTAADRYGSVLKYFDGDYTTTPGSNFLVSNANYSLSAYSSTTTNTAPNLYNGNISGWIQSQLNSTGTGPQAARADLFQYDVLNRIKQSLSVKEDAASGWANITSTTSSTYKTNYTYDANGNILSLNRYDNAGNAMDQLEYTYDTGAMGKASGSNTLASVRDVITTTVQGRSDLQGTHTYSYDATGNLVLEKGVELHATAQNTTAALHSFTTTINWTVYGKISSILKSVADGTATLRQRLSFQYDAGGNRVKKEFWKDDELNPNGLESPDEIISTFYVRDAQGNPMSTYQRFFDPADSKYKIQLIEQPIYGSDRIGENVQKVTLASSTTYSALALPANGISTVSEYQNWITTTSKTNLLPAGSGNNDNLCQCRVISLSNSGNTPNYNNVQNAVELLGIAHNGIAVAEDLNKSLQFFVVVAKKYLGSQDACLIFDRNGRLMKNTETIGSVHTESKPVVVNLPGTQNYAVVMLNAAKQPVYHIVNMNLVGYGPVSNMGEVVSANNLMSSYTSPTTHGYHFTGVEDHLSGHALVYSSRYTVDPMDPNSGSTEIMAYDFGTATITPQATILTTIPGCGSTEKGQLQISPDGTKLAWWQYDKQLAGFDYRRGDIYTLPLDMLRTGISGTIGVRPISQAGSNGNGMLEFMKNSNDILYSQRGVYKESSGAGTKYDRNVWKYDPVNTPALTRINVTSPLAGYLFGEIKRGVDNNYYIPQMGRPRDQVHSYTGSSWNGNVNIPINSNDTTYLSSSLPTQVFKMFDNGSQQLKEYTRSVGNKSYELNDHLGNVRVVISDAKLIEDVGQTAGDIDNKDTFTPEVLNYTDYFAFGAPMPGRNFNSNSTRYGFNGKEKDDEINVSGGSYDFGNRLYDSRLGKWWSIDKLSSKYPFQSPYSFALNNPIYFVDPDGNVVIPGNELVTAAITAKLNTTFSGELEKYRKNFVLETVKYKVGDKEIEVQAFVFKPSTTTAEGATDIFQVNKAIRDSKLSTKDKLMALAYANVINDPDGLIVASLDAVGNQKYNMGNPINPGDGGIGAAAEGDVRTNQTSNEYLTGSVDGAESEKMHVDARGLKASVLKSRDAKTGTVAGVSMSTSASGSLIDEGITEFQDMSPAIKSQVYVKDAAGGKQSLNRSGDIITTPKK